MQLYYAPALSTMLAIKLASETNFPSTYASPRSFTAPRRIFTNCIFISTWSPGIIGIRNLESLIEEKVIQGANGILTGKVLRFNNEPVRHKTLDLIGDLALLGISIKGHVTAARSGHASNVEFVKMIRKEYSDQLD